MRKIVSRMLLALLMMEMLVSSVGLSNSDSTLFHYLGKYPQAIKSLSVESSSLITGVLQDFNGSSQRWRDVAENIYTESYQNSFIYGQAYATVAYEQTGLNFTGTFDATGLKPNFAYQLKIMGKPTEDPISDQHLREIGRTYDIGLNLSVGYVIFDYIVTDRNGEAHKNFSLCNSYHVLWKVNQRTPQANDSIPTTDVVAGSPNDIPHAYATAVGPTTVQIYAEWEKGEPGNVQLHPGVYNAQFIITEESFHSPKGDPTGGYWSTVMGCDVQFTLMHVVPDDYPTIQEAINNANEGDTIFVRNGTYYENVAINKTVSLIGEKSESIIDGLRKGNPVTIIASNVTLSGFSIRNSSSNSAGVYIMTHYDNCNVSENNITDNEYGIRLDWSDNNMIFRNNITANSYDGIFFENSSYNTIFSNNMSTNSHAGIELYCCLDNNLFENRLENNEVGVHIHYYSGLNNLTGNNIINNEIGIHLSGPAGAHSIYHNNLIDNEIQAFLSGSDFSNNAWDCSYPSGGNYWSNYMGIDLYTSPYQNETGSDGIGDIPYAIDESNRDNYPLMKPYPWSSHDVGIKSVKTSKTIVGQRYNTSINVMAFNYGNSTENFTIAVYANSTMIGEIENIDIASRIFSLLSLTWNTTNFAKGNYTMKAVADTLSGEMDIADNNFTDGWITVAMVGDVTGLNGYPDGKVNMEDVGNMAKLFGIDYPDPMYNPNFDIDDDTKINMVDVGTVAKHFGETDP